MTVSSPAAPSPPPKGASTEEELNYYKSQYELLEAELQDFQASSRELEQELEKDIEASEKRERSLREKVESLGFEVDEWKGKYKQSKGDANSAQNALEKEITSMRDTNRTLQLKLRDMEVANDDFERQTRNTTSSLEDLESKYNVAIERGVMLEEEIKVGEQEREKLRIDNQRLRDELSDLKVEAEIVQEKLRLAEATIAQHHDGRKSHYLSTETLRPRSPASVSEAETSVTTLSSPTTSTPPTSKSEASSLSHAPTPPSPPLSESSAAAPKPNPVTPLPTRTRSVALGSNTTPRPLPFASRRPRHSRGPSIPVSSAASTGTPSAPSIPRRAANVPPRPSLGGVGGQDSALPRSGSLYQIRGLIGKMQKLEARVHSARSKLPAPVSTPSPRTGSALGHHPHLPSNIPSNVTVRSARKRVSGTSAGSDSTPSIRRTTATPSTAPTDKRKSVSRLSFGMPPPTPTNASNRPSSRGGPPRPDSRAGAAPARPASRSSVSGARTPLGSYAPSAASAATAASGGPASYHRPRSSMSGRASACGFYGTQASVAEDDGDGDGDGAEGAAEDSAGEAVATPVGRRVGSAVPGTGIPTPSGLPRRQSGRRASMGFGGGGGGGGEGEPGLMRPPSRVRTGRVGGVGETF